MTPKLSLHVFLILTLGLPEPSADASGKRTAKPLTADEADASGLRHAVGIEHVERQIGMFYKLDLAKDNDQARSMVEIMRLFDERLRTCYTDRLEDQPDLSGLLIVRFKLQKNTSNMRKIKRAGGDLSDREMFRCVKRQLASMPFDPPRDIQGTLYYRFVIVEPREAGKSERVALPVLDEASEREPPQVPSVAGS